MCVYLSQARQLSLQNLFPEVLCVYALLFLVPSSLSGRAGVVTLMPQGVCDCLYVHMGVLRQHSRYTHGHDSGVGGGGRALSHPSRCFFLHSHAGGGHRRSGALPLLRLRLVADHSSFHSYRIQRTAFFDCGHFLPSSPPSPRATHRSDASMHHDTP